MTLSQVYPITEDTVPGLTTKIAHNAPPLKETMRKLSTLGATHNLQSEVMRMAQPVAAPQGSSWPRRTMAPWQQKYYPRGPAQWNTHQAGQEINYGFQTARSFAGCGRC